MTGIGFEITDKGVQRAVFDLSEMGKRAKDVRRVATRIRTVVRQSSERRFEHQGPGWPPLADATREKKQAQGSDPRIMRLTSRLYRSLTASSGPDQVDVRDQAVLRFGTSVEYAPFHQFGTRKMPQRELVGLSPAERQQIDELLLGWISKGRA